MIVWIRFIFVVLFFFVANWGWAQNDYVHLLETAEEHYKNGKYDEVHQNLDSALNTNPSEDSTVSLHFLRARCYYSEKKISEAINYLSITNKVLDKNSSRYRDDEVDTYRRHLEIFRQRLVLEQIVLNTKNYEDLKESISELDQKITKIITSGGVYRTGVGAKADSERKQMGRFGSNTSVEVFLNKDSGKYEFNWEGKTIEVPESEILEYTSKIAEDYFGSLKITEGISYGSDLEKFENLLNVTQEDAARFEYKWIDAATKSTKALKWKTKVFEGNGDEVNSALAVFTATALVDNSEKDGNIILTESQKKLSSALSGAVQITEDDFLNNDLIKNPRGDNLSDIEIGSTEEVDRVVKERLKSEWGSIGCQIVLRNDNIETYK